MGNIIYITLEYFFVYSFLGWCAEVVYQAVEKGLVVNRGFLNGPICPIYGIGVLTVFRVLEAAGTGSLYRQNALMIFAFGVVLASCIELVGGWTLGKLFHARWWDYSNQPLNFHGYICLKFSIIWGLCILLTVRGVNPLITKALGLMPRHLGWALLIIMSAAFIADVIISVLVVTGFNRQMEEIDEIRSRMRTVSDDLSKRIGENALETAQRMEGVKLQAALAKAEVRDQADDFVGAYEERKRKLLSRLRSTRHFGMGRLLRAFPDVQHRAHEELLEILKQENIMK